MKRSFWHALIERFSKLSKRQLSVVGFFIVLIVSGILVRTDLMEGLDQKVLDAQFEFSRRAFPQPVRNDPVIVGISESFIDSIDEPVALNHVYIAGFLQAMRKAGPQVIGIDIELPDKRFNTLVSTSDLELDFHKTLLTGLLETVQQQIPLITAKFYDRDRSQFRDIQVDYAVILGMQDPQIHGIASVQFCPDPDGIVRWYPGKEFSSGKPCQPGGSKTTFSSEISSAAGIRKDWSGLINYRLGDRFNYIPIKKVLELSKQDNIAQLKTLFGGKIVLLGYVLNNNDLLDLAVPLAEFKPEFKRVPGVLAHAQILRSMLNQGLIQPVPKLLVFPLCALFALLWFGEPVVLKFLILLLSTAGMLILSGLLLTQAYWLPPSAAMLSGVLAFGGRSAYQGWRNFGDKQRLRRVFSGYVSPGVMKELVEGELDADQKGRRLSVCVLVADVRNFTTMSEMLQAEEVVVLLNRYFTRMVSVIHRHGGTVDKFMGDGLLAFFGAPNVLECPEKNGLAAARDMLVELAELNREFVAEGRAPFRIGIGLHGGEAIIGHIGSAEKREYTAIGDAVNTASRIEGLCKELNCPIVCSDVVAKATDYPADMVNLGERALKGRSSIIVYGWRPLASEAA